MSGQIRCALGQLFDSSLHFAEVQKRLRKPDKSSQFWQMWKMSPKHLRNKSRFCIWNNKISTKCNLFLCVHSGKSPRASYHIYDTRWCSPARCRRVCVCVGGGYESVLKNWNVSVVFVLCGIKGNAHFTDPFYISMAALPFCSHARGWGASNEGPPASSQMLPISVFLTFKNYLLMTSNVHDQSVK